jgi:di/tricarboxylate transporter
LLWGVAGFAAGATILFAPLAGLAPEGRRGLACTVVAVVWWAARVMPAGYTALGLLVALTVLQVAPAPLVFGMFTSPLLYLVVGGYLLAAAVTSSGLGRRIAYAWLGRWVTGYRSLIVSCYVLTFLLSFLIPQPWPRAFLLMGVMAVVIQAAGLSREHGAAVGLAVFAGSAPISMILLTGDSAINVLATSQPGIEAPGWLGWLRLMGVPGVVASVLCCVLQLRLFPGPVNFRLDRERVRREAVALGSLAPAEARTLGWLAVATAGWLTGSIHGLHPGWVTVLAALGLALPGVGGVLGPTHWRQVPLETLVFLAAAVALGRTGGPPELDPVTGLNVGGTGLNAWLAAQLLPSVVPANPFVLAALIAAVAMLLHLALGSVVAAMSIATPALIAFTAPAGINPLVPALITYTAVACHWLLPFHHMNVLVGLGEGNGGYTQREALRLGVPMTAVVFVVVLAVEVPWWMWLGLL